MAAAVVPPTPAGWAERYFQSFQTIVENARRLTLEQLANGTIYERLHAYIPITHTGALFAIFSVAFIVIECMSVCLFHSALHVSVETQRARDPGLIELYNKYHADAYFSTAFRFKTGLDVVQYYMTHTSSHIIDIAGIFANRTLTSLSSYDTEDICKQTPCAFVSDAHMPRLSWLMHIHCFFFITVMFAFVHLLRTVYCRMCEVLARTNNQQSVLLGAFIVQYVTLCVLNARMLNIEWHGWTNIDYLSAFCGLSEGFNFFEESAFWVKTNRFMYLTFAMFYWFNLVVMAYSAWKLHSVTSIYNPERYRDFLCEAMTRERDADILQRVQWVANALLVERRMSTRLDTEYIRECLRIWDERILRQGQQEQERPRLVREWPFFLLKRTCRFLFKRVYPVSAICIALFIVPGLVVRLTGNSYVKDYLMVSAAVIAMPFLTVALLYIAWTAMMFMLKSVALCFDRQSYMRLEIKAIAKFMPTDEVLSRGANPLYKHNSMRFTE